MVAICAEFYYNQPTDWLAIFIQLHYVILTGLGKFTKPVINVAQAYFLPSNRASNIIILNGMYKHDFGRVD